MKMVLPNEILLAEVRNMLLEGHPVIIMTKGNSMLPFIFGDKDCVNLVMPDNPRIGDIALCEIAPGHYVLHRIIGIDGDNVTLKGDGNLKGTEHCRMENICGTVTKIIRKNGKEIPCSSPSFIRHSRLWAKMPYIIRRFTLAIIRRVQ